MNVVEAQYDPATGSFSFAVLSDGLRVCISGVTAAESDIYAASDAAITAAHAFAVEVMSGATFLKPPPLVPMPDDGKFYTWDEASLSWVEVAK